MPIIPDSSGNSGADFLTWDIGGAPSAMGGSYTSIANSIYSIHYNPAGVIQAEEQLIGFSHLQLFSDTNMENLIYIFPGFFNGYFGFSILYSSTIFDWYDLYGNKTALNIYNVSLNLTYGKTLFKNSSLGVTIKGFKRQFDDVSSQGAALDIGLLTHFFHKKLNLGVTLQNFGIQSPFDEVNDPMPLTVNVGINYKLILARYFSIVFSGDLNNNLKEKPNETNEILGLEFNLFDMISIRGGYNFQNENNPITAGIGIKLFAFTVDYAYSYNEYLGNVHYFTIILKPKSLFARKQKMKDKIIKKNNSTENISKKDNRKKEKTNLKKEISKKEEIIGNKSLGDKNIKGKINEEEMGLNKSIKANTKILLFYETAKYLLKEDNIKILRNIIKLLNNFPYKYIVIKGYSDILGENLYNLTLSKKRAERVKRFLLKSGIDKEKIVVKAFGVNEPLGDNDSDIGRQKNRRVEIIIKY